MECNTGFWNTLDTLVQQSEIIIDRLKGTPHPNIQTLFIKQLSFF